MESLRREPKLRMKAAGELFIVKTTLLQAGCPAPHCPEAGFGHFDVEFPNQCLSWWRETGWRLMGWHGSTANVDSKAIKEKIRKFRKNFRQRNKDITEGRLQDDLSQDNAMSQINDGIKKHWCQCCHAECVLVGLVHHLYQSKTCLTAYLQQHMQNRVHMYRGKTGLAVFDLGLLCGFCPNPGCKESDEGEGLRQHLHGACLVFFQKEGTMLLNWSQNLTGADIKEKLRQRKKNLKTFIQHDQGVEVFRKELASVLKYVCHKCSIQGPLLESEVHKILGAGTNLHGPRWECSKCTGGDQEMVMQGVERVRELGNCAEDGEKLKKVLVRDADGHPQRVVFIPGNLLLEDEDEEEEVGDEALNPNSTTVLVPRNPEALDHIGDDASERANQSRSILERVAEFFGRRHFFGPIAETLSVFYRLKLAEIRVERLTMMSSMKRTSKGKITSRNPNHAEVKDRHPHFAQTQKFCFTNTCSWSPAAQEKRSRESAARANVNGQVKIKVEVTVLKKLAVDNPVLRDIIFGLPAKPALISVAPTVLNFLKAKLKLMVKHIIAPTYSNWDLELRFADQEWTVKMVGYLYCEKLEELNSKIARGEVSSNEFTTEVARHQSILPTTALSAQRLMDEYQFSHDRAQVQISWQTFIY